MNDDEEEVKSGKHGKLEMMSGASESSGEDDYD